MKNSEVSDVSGWPTHPTAEILFKTSHADQETYLCPEVCKLHPSKIDEHKQCYALFGRKTKEVDSKERFFSPLLAYLGKHAPVANSTQTRLTAHGEVSVGQLYDPPFTAIHHEGLDGAFQGPDADLLCKVIEDFQLQAA